MKDLQYNQGQGLFAVQYTSLHKAAFDGSADGIKWFLSAGNRKKAGTTVNADDFGSLVQQLLILL